MKMMQLVVLEGNPPQIMGLFLTILRVWDRLGSGRVIRLHILLSPVDGMNNSSVLDTSPGHVFIPPEDRIPENKLCDLSFDIRYV